MCFGQGAGFLFFDVALDLLKRHSGIVWDPGRFRGITMIVGGLYSVTAWRENDQESRLLNKDTI